MKQTKLLSLLLSCIGMFALSGCNSGTTSALTNTNVQNSIKLHANTPEFSYIDVTDLPNSVISCASSSGLSLSLAGVTNDGVISGAINSTSSYGCTLHPFVVGTQSSAMSVITLPNTDRDEEYYSGTIAASGDGVMSGHILEKNMPYTIMTYYVKGVANMVTSGKDIYNHTMAVSENGRYIAGYKTNSVSMAYIRNGLVVVDTVTNTLINNFIYNNEVVGAIIPLGITNNGLVSAVIPEGYQNTPVLCDITSKKCSSVHDDISFIFTISSSGEFIYGEVDDGALEDGLYQVDSQDYSKLKKLPISNILHPMLNNAVRITNAGSLLLEEYPNSPKYIYLNDNQKTYALSELITKLGLDPSKVANSRLFISPNSEYMVLMGYSEHMLIKIRFPHGVEDYLLHNL